MGEGGQDENSRNEPGGMRKQKAGHGERPGAPAKRREQSTARGGECGEGTDR